MERAATGSRQLDTRIEGAFMNWTVGLTARQIAAVSFIFWFTLLGAVTLAWAFQRQNKHKLRDRRR